MQQQETTTKKSGYKRPTITHLNGIISKYEDLYKGCKEYIDALEKSVKMLEERIDNQDRLLLLHEENRNLRIQIMRKQAEAIRQLVQRNLWQRIVNRKPNNLDILTREQ